MNVVIGLVALVLTLAYVIAAEHGHTFNGLFFLPAIVLVSCAPWAMSLVSHRFETLWACMKVLLHAFRFSPKKSRESLFDELNRFAIEIRKNNAAAALAVAEETNHALIRQLAPLVVRQYSGADIEQTAQTATHCLASALRRSEEVFTSLARAAPAAGLVGTVLGLINLLKDLSRFEQLGPSMALALLCTLYGLLLANAVYQPFARLIHSYMTVTVEEGRLVARSLVLLSEGKPLADLRRLFDLPHVPTPIAIREEAA
jgi:chemotaxis protein MotA